MDFRDVTKSALTEYREHLDRACDGLSPVELRWQPTPTSNHILWLVWHIARVEDRWMMPYVGGEDEVWIIGRWCEELRMPSEGGGAGQSAEDVAAFPEVALSRLLAYHDAVRESTFRVIDSLTEADLEKSHPERRPWRNDQPTISWVLAHVAVEESQHVGQIAYIRGMLRGLGG